MCRYDSIKPGPATVHSRYPAFGVHGVYNVAYEEPLTARPGRGRHEEPPDYINSMLAQQNIDILIAVASAFASSNWVP